MQTTALIENQLEHMKLNCKALYIMMILLLLLLPLPLSALFVPPALVGAHYFGGWCAVVLVAQVL
jgi:hypothetical protein